MNGVERTANLDAGRLIRTARRRAGLSLRELAARAGTSHSTLAAYEQGRTIPTVDTFDRVIRAAGFALDVALTPRVGDIAGDRGARGRELIDALELAAMFPARHADRIGFPPFPTAA
jgi:transcriptional regulator with XRE-family HTH domain